MNAFGIGSDTLTHTHTHTRCTYNSLDLCRLWILPRTATTALFTCSKTIRPMYAFAYMLSYIFFCFFVFVDSFIGATIVPFSSLAYHRRHATRSARIAFVYVHRGWRSGISHHMRTVRVLLPGIAGILVPKFDEVERIRIRGHSATTHKQLILTTIIKLQHSNDDDDSRKEEKKKYKRRLRRKKRKRELLFGFFFLFTFVSFVFFILCVRFIWLLFICFDTGDFM